MLFYFCEKVNNIFLLLYKNSVLYIVKGAKMNRLKELRKDKKLTLQQVSDETGVSIASLSSYENGNRKPKIETWQKLSAYFGVPVPYLQGLTGYDKKIDSIEKFKDAYGSEIDKDIVNIMELKKIFVFDNPYGTSDSDLVFIDQLEELLKDKEISELAINNIMGYMTDFFYLSIALTSRDLEKQGLDLDNKILNLASQLIDEFECR